MENFKKIIEPIHTVMVSEILKTQTITDIGRYDASIAIDNELLNSALYNFLQMKEAETSSNIEGTAVTFQDMLMSNIAETEKKDKNEKTDIDEALGVSIAIKKAKQHLTKNKVFSNETIKIINGAILEQAKKDQGVPGEYRKGLEVRVGSYLPPKSKHLARLMNDFEIYIQQQDDTVNPIVKVAIAHAYFELIHPFGDGNGRTGRLLIPFLLYEYNITASPSLFLSSYFEKNRREYYQGLENIHQKDGWNTWVTYFLQAMHNQTKNLNTKAKTLFDLYKHPGFLAMYTADSQVIKNFIFRHPIFTAPMLSKHIDNEEKKVNDKNNLNKRLGRLIEAGDITILEQGRGRRPTWYSCPKIIQTIQE